MNTGSTRLHSLDALRGITIAAMILVNNAGDWGHVYAPLRHARWHGLTPADLIFPFFLFIMGAAIPLSLHRSPEEGISRMTVTGKILRRTAIIFGLGLVLNIIPGFSLSAMRIPGVLQRVALCYLIASLLFIASPPRAQTAWALLLMGAHSLILLLIPVPEFGPGILEPRGNIAWFIDRSLLAGHTYQHAPVAGFDPEGMLGTLTAAATTISGSLAGLFMKRNDRKLIRLLAAGAACLIAGIILNRWIPVNKNLWTASYVLATSGIACLGLLACHAVIDIRGHIAPVRPFLVLGCNSIAVYFLSSLTAKLLAGIRIPAGGGTVSIKSAIYTRCFSSMTSPYNASFCYALTYLLLWLGVAYLLYRKKIFIRI